MAYWHGSYKHPVSANNEELVIVLLGSDEDVKTSCGNTIFGREVFSKSASFERHDGMVLNRRVVTINTPDLLSPALSPEEQQLKRFLHLSWPRAQALLLVLKSGSFTEQDSDTLLLINTIFGAGAFEYVIVVFMHEEDIVDESVRDSDCRSVESLIQRRPHHHLQRKGDQSQVLTLLENIEKMVEGNRGHQLKIEKKVCQSSYSVSLDFIMWYDTRSRVFDQKINVRSSQDLVHPNMCDLRVVLLGENEIEMTTVRKSILHESENLTSSEWSNLMTVSGKVKERHVTVVDALCLMNPNISEHQITQTVRECVYLCHPGPHVFILTVQNRDFTQEYMRRAKRLLLTFSEEALRRTIIITTDEETRDDTSPEIKPSAVNQLMKECEGRHLLLHDGKPECSSEILKMADMILKKAWVDMENYLTSDLFHDVKGTLVEEEEEESTLDESSRLEAENKTNFNHEVDEKPRVEQKSRSDKVDVRKPTTKKIQPTMKKILNLVLCGSDTTLIVSVSKYLRGKRIKPSHHRTDNEVYVRKAEKIHCQKLSVVELPSLSVLSEEEVTRQTLLSVSLCQTGVHAFIIVVNVGPLTDEDKAEIEKILKIFDSKEHFMVLFISDHTNDTLDSLKHSSDFQDLISRCGGQYRLMGLKESQNSRQIPDLLDYIENMKTEPYSLAMYVKAQEKRSKNKLEDQHKKNISEMENKIKELTEKIQLDGAEVGADLECLRIVLIGRTGNGKSAVGNTVLGRNEFVSQMSSDSVTTFCKRGVGRVAGRSVAVVDTPGLFDSKLTNDEMVDEIVKCVTLSSPGPHVFVIVLSLGRITKEEDDTLDLIKMIFGPKAAQFSIVLFTRGEDLQGESIDDYVRKSKSAELKKLIRDCGDRFMVFNKREKHDRTQVTRLIEMIEELKNTNQGRFFTNSMFEEAEMNIKYRMEEITKEKERENKSQTETLKARYNRGMKDMLKRFADDRHRAEEERIKIEKHFRENEEKLRKEFEEKEETEQKKRETEYQKLLEEENQRRAEYHQKTEELKREIENQRSENEKQRREREEEDRKKEEKYRQDQEKMKHEQEQTLAELQMKQHEEIRNRDLEKKQRIEEEEEERQRWKRRIKEAENERKEIQEEIKQQQREWEEEKKRQMREREEEEKKRKEKHEEQLREKQEELEKMRTRFEREQEEERQKQRREREEKEREYEEKKQEIKRHYEQLERERKEEWERRKREDEERREEERKRWRKKIEDLKQERDKEFKSRETERRRKQEKEREQMKQKYEEEIKQMKEKQDEDRKQLRDYQKQHEILENLYQHLKEEKREEIQELQRQVIALKNKPGCAIM